MIGDQNKINKIYGAVAFKKEQNFFKDILGIKSIDHFKTFVTITITIAILIGVLWSLIYFYDIKAYLNLSGESIIWILLASISIGIFVLFVFFFIVFFPYLYSNSFNIYQNNKFFSVLILLLLLIPWLFVFIILSITTKSVMISGLCTLLLLLIIALISIYFKYDIKRILPEYLVFFYSLPWFF